MASQGVAANSRLAEMQMKFQRKQMLEREQKKLALRGGDLSEAGKSAIGNGKVRQMFDDRRRVVGIDRSHPLRPIAATTTSSVNVTTKSITQQLALNKRTVGGSTTLRRPGLINTTPMQNSSSTSRSSNNNSPTINGNHNNNVFHNNFDEVDNIDNESFPKEFSSLSLNNGSVMDSLEAHDFENNNNDESSSFGGTIIINKRTSPKITDIKLNPVITKKSPTSPSLGKTTSRAPTSLSRTSTVSKATTSTIRPPPKANVSSTTNKSIKGTPGKTASTKPATFILSVKPPPRISTPPPGMVSCQYCQRHFNEERLEKHEEVCRKMMNKKRKIFDASKHRVQGTEAEKYLKKGKSFGSAAPKTVTASTNATAKKPAEKPNNWRKKHEEFITAIREAKKVQAHLAKGGKLSDLPPPPPSENPDYIQCPHCSRRFNESAAERHIPKCANMQHNKPKPSKKRF